MNTHDIDIELPPLPSPLGIVDPEGTEGMMQYTASDLQAYATAYARAAVLADRQQRGGDVIDDMRAAVRFAPSSAYWSERLREFFGPDAREGIDALEKQLREARAALTANAEPQISDAIFLICARLGMAGASDEEVLRYVRTAITTQGEKHG